MNEFNPYAAPATDLSTPRDPTEVGVWSDGSLLVMTKDAELPDRCLKCNEKTGGWRLTRKLSWHSPVWYVLIVSPLLYVLAALLVRKTARVRVPLCPRHRRRRRRLIGLAWLLCLLGPVVLLVGSATEMEARGLVGNDAAVAITMSLVGLGLLMLISGIVVASEVSRVARPRRIDKRYVWIQKVHPDFLDRLPAWIPEPPRSRR